MPRTVRNPSHAGSWYTGDGPGLAKEIDEWMGAVSPESGVAARAVIAPTRVFLLGPSHHVYTKKCALSTAQSYHTPLGSMEIDQEVYAALKGTKLFETMDLDVDEAEHSLELHTPYIVRTMRDQAFKLVPIMVGSLTTESEALYGEVLGPYLDDPANIFVVSSDFCHWGSRFSYTFYDNTQGPIWQSIEWLDRLGMDIIETGDPAAFAQYLGQYRNTICGRHPIGVFLNMLQHCRTQHRVQFKHYDQSSKCMTKSDSSVSYAAAIVTAHQG